MTKCQFHFHHVRILFTMIARLKIAQKEYPSQFWILFFGMLISTIGQSMIWPFLMIYVSKKLALPLVQTASLISMNAAMGLIFSFVAGPIIDRLGRKWIMVVSLIGMGVMYFFMSTAATFIEFAIAQCLMGALTPLYRVGADAMLADLIPTEKRTDAYSLLRMSNNAGVAIGPAIGGFVASTSYTLAFYIAAAGLSFFGFLIAFRAKETLPGEASASLKGKSVFSGYGHIFQHREFMGFIGAFTLTSMLASLVWVLLPVYSNTNFGLPEKQYGFIPTTNAVMVVAMQYLVTLVTRKHKPMAVLTVGTIFYAVSTAMIALFTGFWGFWFCMVIMTIGELIVSPTATTYTANAAPVEMRGRYMSVFGLTSSVASLIAPILGGSLSDHFGGRSIWLGGGVIGVLAIGVFLWLTLLVDKHNKAREVLSVSTDS
jgi:MFS family permease